VTDAAVKYLYFARVQHPNEEVAAENVLEFCAGAGIPAREVILHPDGRLRSELGDCLADALAIVSPNWHLDHSCIGDRLFLDVAAEAGVPVVQWFFDHASARWPEFAYTTAENSRFLFHSAYSEAYFRRFILPNCRSSWVATYGPHRSSRVDDLTLNSFLARDIRCLAPLNLRRIGGALDEIEQRREALANEFRGPVAEAIEFAYHDLEEPIETYLLSISPSALTEEPGLLHRCVQIIEESVQFRRRIKVFEVAQEFPVLLQSDIASKYLREGAPAALEEGVSIKKTFERMRRSRSVISLTHLNDQLHNRVSNALNAGAVNIIEDNKAHRRIFKHGENALLFRYDDDSLREALDLVCFAPEKAFRIAEAGLALRDDPRLRFGGFNNLIELIKTSH
jgi:hypothetical protein